MLKTIVLFLFCILLSFGCSRYSLVDYRDVDKTNSITIALDSGTQISGTVVNIEPYQIVLRDKNDQTVTVQKSVVRNIKRRQPVLDDFGNGISDQEIRRVQTKHNTTIYGIGGGALSLGVSFFLGSMIANASDRGGAGLTNATIGGTMVGTALFLHAGKNKDRQTAIRKVKDFRRSTEITPSQEKKSPEQMQQLLDSERQKQEELRKERENLLKQLQQPPSNP